MTSERIKEIQKQTAYPESVSVMFALKQVWNECEQERVKNSLDLESKEFFDLMQQYRIAPPTNQERVINAFDAVKEWLKSNYR